MSVRRRKKAIVPASKEKGKYVTVGYLMIAKKLFPFLNERKGDMPYLYGKGRKFEAKWGRERTLFMDKQFRRKGLP